MELNEILVLVKKYYVVPRQTVKKLRRRILKPRVISFGDRNRMRNEVSLDSENKTGIDESLRRRSLPERKKTHEEEEEDDDDSKAQKPRTHVLRIKHLSDFSIHNDPDPPTPNPSTDFVDLVPVMLSTRPAKFLELQILAIGATSFSLQICRSLVFAPFPTVRHHPLLPRAREATCIRDRHTEQSCTLPQASSGSLWSRHSPSKHAVFVWDRSRGPCGGMMESYKVEDAPDQQFEDTYGEGCVHQEYAEHPLGRRRKARQAHDSNR
ncbi:hypothetical protein MLD38_016052 [Melastoma candidum]|uniref:Uncharacterized protein n=1 Tax=Melastoma candidum TaxID=119954 RepID=A0ACB9RRM5_9MYRT|nr:hypothetical protein MLD38_016052 [Melastoma candidum]